MLVQDWHGICNSICQCHRVAHVFVGSCPGACYNSSGTPKDNRNTPILESVT